MYVNVTATTDTSDALDCSLYVTCGDSGDGSYDVSISPGKLLQTTFDCPHDSTIISVFDADSDDSLDSYHYTVVGESGQEDTVMVKGSFEGSKSTVCTYVRKYIAFAYMYTILLPKGPY